ncbi:MAG: carbon-nitrogen hydrolase family protein [Nitrospiraceae bacterium]
MPPATPPPKRIAFLHLAPTPGDVPGNQWMIERGIERALAAGATWILTPELARCGYGFASLIGTDWIAPQPDDWMTRLLRMTAQHRATLLLSTPERDRQSNHLYNSLFVLGPTGTVLGTHRKINALRMGSEAWSTSGTAADAIRVADDLSVGLMICADAASPRIATTLQAQGARLLVSAAAWAPGHHGPSGEWERCSRETGLPLLACNRTGRDTTLDFTNGESVVVQQGRRVLTMTATRSTVCVIDWNDATQSLASPQVERIELS